MQRPITVIFGTKTKKYSKVITEFLNYMSPRITSISVTNYLLLNFDSAQIPFGHFVDYCKFCLDLKVLVKNVEFFSSQIKGFKNI